MTTIVQVKISLHYCSYEDNDCKGADFCRIRINSGFYA